MKRTKLLRYSLLASMAAVSLCGKARADFNPVALTPGSFNADVVVEKTAPPTLNSYVSATMDGGTNNNAWVFYEIGYATSWPWTGVPAQNSTFTAASDANRQYQMPPDYTANNAVFVGNYAGFTTGTLNLTTPAAYGYLSVLGSAGGGATTLNYTVHHSGGADEVGSVIIQDWFGGSTFAWYANGRVNMDNGNLGSLSYTNGTGVRISYVDIPLGDTVNPVTSIDFAYASGGRAAIFGLSGSTDATTYSAIPVTGFDRDMIVEATAPKTGFNPGANVTMDGDGVANQANGWYEKGFNRSANATNTGVPVAGSSITTNNHTWTMPPSYTANNVVFLANTPGYLTQTITLSSPAAYTALSFLNAAGNGPVAVSVTVHHSADPDESFSFNSQDWFNNGTVAYVANGRYVKESLTFNNVNGGAVILHNNDITLAGASSVTSIDLAWTSGGRTMIFALAGANGGNFNPVAFTGFNADGVVEASIPAIPFPLTTATTASMDGGTNNTGATWYESGYYTNTASPGLPTAGSTFNSQALADHHYQMPASYSANNAAFVDAVQNTINLTPATPAAYSALSFLNACANGSVTNTVVIQYQDGTSETNLFIGSDWFNTSVPYAYSSRGRTDLNRRTINNDPGRTGSIVPRLFEAQFFLSNFSSPVTNLLLQYANPTNSTGRIVVFGVSAATGAVGPIIGNNPISPPLFIETSNITFTVGSVLGTTPITNRWQYSPDGGTTWNNLSDGGQISGATTPTLVVTAAGVTNNGLYRLMAVNTVGTNYSGSATISALSGYANVPLAGDPITAIGPNIGGGAEGPASAIDHTLQKYLNFGANNGSPFVGPIGFTVTPSQGASVIKAIRVYTANDASDRDPADYTLEGSNDGVTWSLISTNPLSLSTTRNTGNTAITVNSPLTNVMQEVDFYGNTSPYYVYRVTINNVRNNATAVACQLGEFELLGFVTTAQPIIVRQPVASVTSYVGGSPTFGVGVLGAQLSYQWSISTDGGTIYNPIPSATNATYTKSNVQLTDSTGRFRCFVTNSAGQVTSSSALLTVIAAPTTPYEAVMLADGPAAYWPLNEGPDNGSGNAGTVVNDYTGGHNGTYTNVLLGVSGFNPVADPDTASSFGTTIGYAVDSYAGNMQDLTFAAPTNTTTAAFTVEAWVLNSPSSLQTSDAGLVTKGAGGGGEQFNLDCGSGGDPHLFRFFVRDATGATHGANGTIGSTNVNGPFPNGGLPAWHHVVGVYDAPNGQVVLYVDGVQNAITVTPLTNGVLSSASPISIGSRQSGAGSAYNNQFDGTIQDVAIYNFALSSNQVRNHYYAAQPLPVFTVQPTNTTAAENGPSAIYSSAYGPPALTYQWYESIDSGANFSAMAGKTSNNLAFASTPAANNGYQYFVAATDPYGTSTSSIVTLSVVQGPPYFITDLPATTLVYAGATVQLSVEVGGTAPFSYQWTSNGVALSDGGRFSGTHSNVLTIANTLGSDSAIYQVAVSNAQSGGVGGPLLSTQDNLYVETTPDFNTNGLGWAANGGATFANNAATLTEAVNSQARSVWYQFPLYVGSFYASFTYQDVSGGGADGLAFCLQNDPDGTTALGGAGGALGLSGITPSAALTFNIYGGSPGGVGISFGLNGANGAPYNPTTPVAIDSTDPIQVTVIYDGSAMRVTLNDSVASASYTTNIAVGSLPTMLGADTAYVGFTAATGGINAQQVVSNFFYVPLPTLAVQTTGPGTALLSWPASIGGYTLQSNTALDSPGTWQNVNAPVTIVGGQNQVSVSSATGVQFYRLVMPTFGPQ